jgi:hypothetical protein
MPDFSGPEMRLGKRGMIKLNRIVDRLPVAGKKHL